MRYASLAAATCLLFSTGMAMAGTKVQGNVVTDSSAAPAGVDTAGKSKFKLSGAGAYQFGLKGITDSAGNPAALTTGPVDEYIALIKGDAAGITWQYNIRVPITKEGQAKVKGSVTIINAVPVGTAVGVLGAEVHEAPTPATAAACDAVMNDMTLPGVWLDSMGANPCASGTRIGLSGVVTAAP